MRVELTPGHAIIMPESAEEVRAFDGFAEWAGFEWLTTVTAVT